ncbi:MAG: hypothetical protein IK955_06245 [Clostridia bacterium]|nr:hypothetical protein [Clostridia bacterium]
MAKAKKGFNAKLYAVIVFFLVAAILASITVITFKNRYIGFDPEKVAVAYVESIVTRGDGYNAYKNALVSKNYKYGDYIREYYMYPVIYAECNYKPGDDTDTLKGYNDESYMSDATKNDDGTLAGAVIDRMYPYYVELIVKNNGWDNYDVIFKKYFRKLAEVRENTFGDKYLTDEIMFTALEANVASYGEELTGTDEVIDENTKLKISEKKLGLYEEKFGEDYRITCEVVKNTPCESLEGYKKSLNKEALETYKISVDEINEAVAVVIEIKANGEKIGSVSVNVVKIGGTWYVETFNTKTADLYNIAPVEIKNPYADLPRPKNK